jgi:hypothetical protein
LAEHAGGVAAAGAAHAGVGAADAGQPGWVAALTPLSVDGMIVAA